MNQITTWQLVPAAPNQEWAEAFAACGPRIGTFDATIRDVLATAPAPGIDVLEALQTVRAALAFLPANDTAVAGLDRVIAALEGNADAAGGAAVSTEARTGNTAGHQAAWFAGIEQGQTNARNNAGIGAQQLQERADKVVIENAANDPELFLDAVKDLLAAVRMFRPVPAAGGAPALPVLDADLIEILGRPSFTCAFLAQVLRNGGRAIKKKAEHEQAAVIHFMLCQYLAHGSKWREAATSAFQAIAAQHRSQGGR